MINAESLEPKKYYGYIPIYSVAFTLLISAGSFLFQPNMRVVSFFLISYVVIDLIRRRRFPIFTFSSHELCFNISRGALTTSGEWHIPVNIIQRIWIGNKEFPIRKYFFLNPELDAIFVLRDDERPLFLLTLNQFKPKDREEIKVLIRNIQETVDLKQKEIL